MSTAARGLGAVDGAALIVASVVGAGIFTVPAYVARLAASPSVILPLWLGGGLLALAGALCYAELAARFPRGGAEYVYLREAFGDTTGFLSGWTSFVAGFSGAIAAAAVGFAAHLATVIPALSGGRPASLALGPLSLSFSATSAVALLLIALFTAVSIAGVRASRVATNALALLVVVGIVVLAVAGAFGGAQRQATAAAAPTASVLTALVPIFFTYSGWNAAAYMAGEFRDPRRTVPRALALGTLLVTVLYLALNASMLHAISASGVASTATPVAETAQVVVGASGGALVTALVLAALASSVCALVITGPRIYAEMARDGSLPSMFAGRWTRDGASAAAIVAQSVWSGLLVLSGTFEQIVTYTGVCILLFSGLAVSAVFVLRRRLGAPTTFAVPGYPLVPLLFVACIVAVAVASFRHAPAPSLAGLLLIAIGIPVRLLARASACRIAADG